MSHQHCYTHNCFCPLFGEDADSELEVAGLPCTDQSRSGKRLYEEGPTMIAFMAHAKRHIEKKTALIIIENVQELGLKKHIYLSHNNKPKYLCSFAVVFVTRCIAICV